MKAPKTALKMAPKAALKKAPQTALKKVAKKEPKRASKKKELPSLLRFPWAASRPGGSVEPSPSYAFELPGRHLVLTSHQFCAFMKYYWAIEIWDYELNIFEYFGWLLPVRKAIVDDLRPPSSSYSSPKGQVEEEWQIKWCHLPADHRRESLRAGAPASSLPSPIEHQFPPHPATDLHSEIERSRLTPWLFLEPSATLTGFGSRVEPQSEAKWCSPGALRREHRWFRPTDLAYWRCLSFTRRAVGLLEETERMTDRRRSRPIRGEARPELLEGFNLNLTRAHAAEGNQGVERFYIVGRGDRSEFSRPTGSVGRGYGQDWALAELLGRLRFRTDLQLQIGIAEASQATTASRREKVYRALAARARDLQRHEHLALPQVVPTFYRDAVICMAHQHFRRNQAGLPAYETLRRETGLGENYVRKAVSAGRRLLGVDTNS
jgi:hypothetical protein